MRNIMFLGSISLKRNRLDGVTVKSRTLLKWLQSNNYIVNVIDTDNWTKNIIYILFKFFISIFRSDFIILSSADRGAYYALKLLNLLKIKKPIYYLVAGGRLGERIIKNEYNYETYKKCTRIYVESKLMYDQIKEYNLNVKVLNNFREIPSISSKKIENDIIKFIYFGRIIPEKGITDALVVMNNLREKGYNLKFDLYGQVKSEYLSQIKKYLNNDIKYKGEYAPDGISEYNIYSQYDVLVFPTKYPGECLPGTLIEAYIAGLTILASEWKYAKEYIEHEKVGYLFNYNDISEFEKVAEKLINEKEKIKDFKENSKKYSSKFDVNTVLNELHQDII
ncbi:glycosyltransferase [Bacillus sp. AFS017336]|uniref:glycosyltransferase n=1 Tax=Bacillus sp. AFS017336 TaxID=2033489 RepID=UPI000BEF784A|nr:glycosyltransferase [Bacillus sp. AFS017336]PEL13553.1 hypothetical protein CN601_03860 [Bacillus sp. AFS017336]